jgi:hypothetical protein
MATSQDGWLIGVIIIHNAISTIHFCYNFVGDSGYPQEDWLMTPVVNPRTPAEQLYNDVHITTRNPIERCIGALKSRFRCLAMTDGALVYSPEKVCAITFACCVLHNICLQQGEVMAVDPDVIMTPEII